MTVALRDHESPRLKRWTKAEYLRLVERGAFDEDGHYYLFRGEIIDMSPMGTPHAIALMKATSIFSRLFSSDKHYVRVQLPFDAPGDSVPEPDLLVCTAEQAFVVPYTRTALLIMEVAESSIDHDREKALEYAASGTREYWIVDLNSRRIEIYRDPVPDAAMTLGWRYSTITTAGEHQTISTVAMPDASIAVSSLLP